MTLPTGLTPASISPERAVSSSTGVPLTSSEQTTKGDNGHTYLALSSVSRWCALLSSSFGAEPHAWNPMLLTTPVQRRFDIRAPLRLWASFPTKPTSKVAFWMGSSSTLGTKDLLWCLSWLCFLLEGESIMCGLVFPSLSAVLKNRLRRS